MLLDKNKLKNQISIMEDAPYEIFRASNCKPHIYSIKLYQDRLVIYGCVGKDNDDFRNVYISIDYDDHFRSKVKSEAIRLCEWDNACFHSIKAAEARFYRERTLVEKIFHCYARIYSIDDIINLVVNSYATQISVWEDV